MLLGTNAMDRISRKRVILFGVGGVGSWCAESLIRNGICHLTIVDSDCVNITNCNRQLMATTKTIGMVKVDVMRERLLEINPMADIVALHKIYNEDNADEFELDTYDYIIDAIDSLKDKTCLILHGCHLAHENKNITFISSMGAALHIDPAMIRVAEFWKISGDPLARAIRNKFKRNKQFPESKFLCVYSEETPLKNKDAVFADKTTENQTDTTDNLNVRKINGSLSHITGIFGMTLAGLVIKREQDLMYDT